MTFNYAVTNPGNASLSGVAVRDDGGTPADPADDFDAVFTGGDADGDGQLDPGETWSFAASRLATAGPYTNVATAAGTPPGGGAAVSATDAGYFLGLTPLIAVGSGPGAPGRVGVTSALTGALVTTLAPFGAFAGGVTVAAADVTGDGFDDVVVGAGAGGGPHVKVFDGATGAEVRSFFAFGAGFAGGVFVAAGDVTGDRRDDVIVGAGPGSPGGHVKVFDGATGAEVRSFFAYAPSFAGGGFVVAGDVDGDGRADVITGAGAGGGPHVKVFDGATGAEVRSFFAFEPAFAGGVRVAAVDRDGDGRDDLVAGAGAGSRIKVFSGVTLAELASFSAFDTVSLGVFVG